MGVPRFNQPSSSSQLYASRVRPLHAACALTAAVAVTAWAIAGALGLLYLLALAAASLAGLPWGLTLFGRRHAAGWVAGLLFGYAITGFIWWAGAVALGRAAAWVVALWAVVAIASWLVTRRLRTTPLCELPPWGSRETSALLVVLLLVPVLAGRPFSQIGHESPDGSRLYRAYFTADFVWHVALVEELSKRVTPPVDPYLAPEPLHYYWTYFLVPAGLRSFAGGDAVRTVALTAVWCGLLFVATLYLIAWAAVPDRRWIAAVAVALVMLCGSAEGAVALAYFWWNGVPLEMTRSLNVDALAAWAFHGLRVDNLPRALWYTPQHAAAFAFGSIASLTLLTLKTPLAGIVLAGGALGVAITLNPFVGGVFALVYGLSVAWHALRDRRPALLARHAVAVLPCLAALAWSAANQVLSGATGVLHFGWWGPGTHAPVATLLLSFMPAALPVLLLPVLAPRAMPAAALPALLGIAISLVVMYSVALVVDPHWVGFRTGHLIFGWLPVLVAVVFARLQAIGNFGLAEAVALTIVVLGLPTTVIDAYNAQDVANTADGPGFHWTLTLPPESQAALAWIRANTPDSAIVQAEPISRGREWWSLIPSFAGRRMAGGLPISLMHVPEFDTRSREVQQIFASPDAAAAVKQARALHIDYLYVDDGDRRRYPETAKFDAHPELFAPVFRDHAVGVYAVR